MRRSPLPTQPPGAALALLGGLAGVLLAACSGTAAGPDQPTPPTGGTGGAAGVGGAPGTAGTAGGGQGGSGQGGSGQGGSGQGGTPGTGGLRIEGGTGGSGAGGSAGRGGTGGAGAGNCALPATVSFQRDLQPFLITACGGGNGCHVIDAASTMSNGGFNHAYDWITAGAHPSSCPETPTPKRFQVVLDVIHAANPPTCSRARIMPPQNETGANLRKPLTSCQVALLQGWLAEPLVTQTHRVDDTDPAQQGPFPMPPFN